MSNKLSKKVNANREVASATQAHEQSKQKLTAATSEHNAANKRWKNSTRRKNIIEQHPDVVSAVSEHTNATGNLRNSENLHRTASSARKDAIRKAAIAETTAKSHLQSLLDKGSSATDVNRAQAKHLHQLKNQANEHLATVTKLQEKAHGALQKAKKRVKKANNKVNRVKSRVRQQHAAPHHAAPPHRAPHHSRHGSHL